MSPIVYCNEVQPESVCHKVHYSLYRGDISTLSAVRLVVFSTIMQPMDN